VIGLVRWAWAIGVATNRRMVATTMPRAIEIRVIRGFLRRFDRWCKRLPRFARNDIVRCSWRDGEGMVVLSVLGILSAVNDTKFNFPI